MEGLTVRQAEPRDVPALCDILNTIIEIGGTTAYEVPLTEKEFELGYLSDEHSLSCLLASDEAGRILGFQALLRNSKLAESWADIATFAAISPKVKGTGTALFDSTVAFAKSNNIVCINARIRADNILGLGYYSKMGFVDYAVKKAEPLRDGTPVDRISKKYPIR